MTLDRAVVDVDDNAGELAASMLCNTSMDVQRRTAIIYDALVLQQLSDCDRCGSS